MPETWHEPVGRSSVKFVVEPAGEGYIHPVTTEEVAERIEQLPKGFRNKLEIVQFSRMTRKRALFPCYGMQWGTAVYLYPIESTLGGTLRVATVPGTAHRSPDVRRPMASRRARLEPELDGRLYPRLLSQQCPDPRDRTHR